MLLATQVEIAGILEAMMLICFGAGWPVAIVKTLRVKVVSGKSVGFLSLVLAGYLAGIGAKFVTAAHAQTPVHWVAWLYAANGLMVALDICLYFRYRHNTVAADSIAA